MNATQIADDLEAAAEVLERGGLLKHQLYNDDFPGMHCAAGAIYVAATGKASWIYINPEQDLRVMEAVNAVAIHLGESRVSNVCLNWTAVIDWNNAPERTVDEVIEVFRATAKDLRNEAAPQ